MATSSVRSGATTHWLSRLSKAIAKSRSVKGGNYVALSTTDRDTAEPRCRMVVFRGFVESGPDDAVSVSTGVTRLPRTRLKMVTDARSSKVMNEGEQCELCWWFGRTSEQFRVRGKLLYVGPDEEPVEGVEGDERAYLSRQRMEQWGKMRDAAKAQFFWDSPGSVFSGAIDGGEIVDADHEQVTPPGGEGGAAVADAGLQTPPANFLLMLLDPSRVDHLSLRTDVRIVDEIDVSAGGASDVGVGSDPNTRTWMTYRVNP